MENREQIERAEKLVNEGLSLFQQNRLEEAIEKWKVAKPVLEELRMDADVADIEMNIGKALRILGRPTEGLGHFEAAKPICERLEMHDKLADIETNICNSLIALGRPTEGLSHFEVAKPIYERLGMHDKLADIEMYIGAALCELGKPTEGLRHFEAAKPIYERLEMQERVAAVEMNIGNARALVRAEKLYVEGFDLVQQNRLEEAIEKWETAKTIFLRFEVESFVAGVEMNIGAALCDLGRPTEGLGHFEAAKSIYERLGMHDKVARIEMNITRARADKLFNEGIYLAQQKRHDEALDKFKLAKLIFESLKIPYNIAQIEFNIGIALYKLDRPDEALRHYDAAKPIFERLEKYFMVAGVELNIGATLHALTRYVEALEHLEAAKPIYEKLERYDKVADVERNIGYALRDLDRPSEAFRHFMAAKCKYEMLMMPDTHKQVATIENDIGVALLALGKPAEALTHFKEAKSIYERHNMDFEVAGAELNIGIAFQDLGDSAKALKHYEIVKPFFVRQNMDAQVALSENNIGVALADLGYPKKALTHYEVAREIYGRLKKPLKVAKIELNIAPVLISLNKPTESLKKCEDALDVFKDFSLLMDQGKAYQNMGSASVVLGNYKRAKHDLNKSFNLMERVRVGVRSPELQRSLKKDYIAVSELLFAATLSLHEKGNGPEHVVEAFNHMELVKCNSVAEYLEAGGRGVPCPEAEELIIEEDRLLNIAKDKYRKLLELTKLRVDDQLTRDQFRGSYEDWEKEYDAIHGEIERLRSEVMLKCADYGSTPIPRTYNVLERALQVFPKDVSWCILEFVIVSSFYKSSSGKLIVFLIFQDPLVHYAYDVDLGEVQELAFRCQQIVEKVRRATLSNVKTRKRKIKEINDELAVLSKELYSALIPQGIGKVLKSRDVENLIIVPHKSLHWVPFEALHDGEDYWGLKYAVSTSFSLDLARLSVEKRRRRSTKLEESPSFLLVKNPLCDLTGADEEVDSLRGMLEEEGLPYRLLEHEEATQPAFVEAANEEYFTILFYAGHALFMGKNPSQSSLNLHTDGDCPACRDKAGHHTYQPLSAAEIINGVRFKGAPIVYLSSCESGVTEVDAGDEMFGLVRALMYAGGTSLVVSRWPVSDRVSPVFAEEFYRRLFDGESVAVALRNARRKVFQEAPLNFTDWAVFSLQGDPFRRFSV